MPGLDHGACLAHEGKPEHPENALFNPAHESQGRWLALRVAPYCGSLSHISEQ
jgi:hypothetical protein